MFPWPLSRLCFLRETVPSHVKAMPLPVFLPLACASSVVLSCASGPSPFPMLPLLQPVDILKSFSLSASRSLPLAPSFSSYTQSFSSSSHSDSQRDVCPFSAHCSLPVSPSRTEAVQCVPQAPPTVAGGTVRLSFLVLLAFLLCCV